MSSDPGIGRSWFDKYEELLWRDDFVVMEGRRFRVPQYYQDIMKAEAPTAFESLKARRSELAAERRSRDPRSDLEINHVKHVIALQTHDMAQVECL